MIADHVSELIGNTPLLRISSDVHGLTNIDVYAKCEYLNPFGSLKDRVAKAMFDQLRDGVVEKGQTVVESSSGNTAKALALLCGTYGIPFKTITSRIRYPEVRMILQALGADLEELPSVSECPDPFDPDDFLAVAKNLVAAEPEKYVLTDQYFNPANPAAHYGTGLELLEDLGTVDYFTSFLGTCGSTTGVGKALREQNEEMSIIGVVSSPGHVVPGGRMVNELWEVGFFDRSFYSDIVEGNTDEAIDGMLELDRRMGMTVGPTTGLTFHAMRERLRPEDDRLRAEGKRATAVFIACDRMEPYTSFLKKHRPALFAPTASAKPRVNALTPEQISASAQITAAQLQAATFDGPPMVIDVRGNFAFNVGHIEGSINILDELLTTMVEQGRVFPHRPIVLVCAIGNISRRYAAFLQSQGYDASSLEGGLAAWKQAQLPLENSLAGAR